MTFQRHREKSRGWREWLRRHQPMLCRCGLPPAALRSELDWFVFLDHGYVQTADSPTNWWSVRLLAAEQAGQLAEFITAEYPGRYVELVSELQRLSGA